MHDDSSSALVPLTKGQFAIVDAEDDPRVRAHSWSFQSAGYAAARIRGKYVLMHRLLTNAQPGQWVDHINGNRLDNRRSVNLRLGTPGQNRANAALRPNNTSGFRGVYWDKCHGKWHAQISEGYGTRYLGLFDDVHAAARAYDAAAVEVFGVFARLNFPVDHGEP